MTITLTFKTPDALDDALDDAFGAEEDHPDDEDLLEKRANAKDVCEKFIRYGEYVTIAVDVETGKAIVVRPSGM